MSAKKSDQPTNPDIKVCIDAYHDGFFQRHGFKPDDEQYGRFAKELGRLLRLWSKDVVLQLLDDFLNSTDPRVVRKDWKPMDFIDLAQFLYLQRQNGGLGFDRRTAANFDAARRATRRT